MNIILTSTALVALAEMGDKTQLLAILLATRFRKLKKVVLAYSGGLDTSRHPEMAAGPNLWLRGGDLHRRSGPGRGAGTGARQGRS
jgi:hypothetical protein